MSSGSPPRRRPRSVGDVYRMMRNPEVAAAARDELMNMVAHERQREAQLTSFANSLPKLTESDLETLGESDSTCPICLTSLLAVLAEEEMALAMDTPAHPVEELGVTRLVDTCGHIFCRKDIRGWLYQGNTTCPTCRRPFIAPAPGDDARARERDLGFPGVIFTTRLQDGTQVGPFGMMDFFSLGSHDAGRPRDAEPDPFGASSGDDGGPPDRGGRRDHSGGDDDRSAFSSMYS
ncbi:hypothetical protein BV20DRAFT_964221 [Pilatotrama ljubarskyi]|nr:hypothetical protein BV20DRAFT_964221 [Pilatotrama ljubarskyi]